MLVEDGIVAEEDSSGKHFSPTGKAILREDNHIENIGKSPKTCLDIRFFYVRITNKIVKSDPPKEMKMVFNATKKRDSCLRLKRYSLASLIG